MPARPYRTAGAKAPSPLDARRPVPILNPGTWGVVLSQIALVFLVFAAVNVRTLFGGHAFTRAAGTATYAEYLHAGFAQLSVASFLAIVMVAAGHRMLRVPGEAIVPGGARLAAVEVALLGLAGVALLSCVQRLRIYQAAYGYTHLRLAVAFCQLAVFGLLALSAVKATRRGWRGYPVAVTVFGVVGLLVAAWFDADLYVARGNVARAAAVRAGTADPFAFRQFDVDYLGDLSRDAMPVLSDPFFQNEPEIAGALRERWLRGAPQGWRSFSRPLGPMVMTLRAPVRTTPSGDLRVVVEPCTSSRGMVAVRPDRFATVPSASRTAQPWIHPVPKATGRSDSSRNHPLKGLVIIPMKSRMKMSCGCG